MSNMKTLFSTKSFEKHLILDIETDSKASKIWLVVTTDCDTKEVQCHTDATTLIPLIENAELIGHNLIAFDAYHLNRLWKTSIHLSQCSDTLVLGRLLDPQRPAHSLESWGNDLGCPKDDYKRQYREKYPDRPANDCWDRPDMELLTTYCVQDVKTTLILWSHLTTQLAKQEFSPESIRLEHEVQYIIAEQQRNGFKLDIPACQMLLNDVTRRHTELAQILIKEFGPTLVQMKTKVKEIPFNPNSRQQIGKRLMERGWKPTKFTDTGKPKVDEKTVAACTVPEAALCVEYLTLEKRRSQIQSWLDAVQDDGRVHGSVNTNGAVTGRMTHFSPNMGQTPSKKKFLGKECRAVWVAEKPYVLFGFDASGLELRMLAHYMNDPEYTREVVDGDVHSKNQAAAGLPTRDDAKTFIYAFLYGAGDAKIGQIVKGTARDGEKLKAKFLAGLPALGKLIKKVQKYAAKKYLPGLDGRKLFVRSEHSALNTLLQGAGAILMKVFLCLFYRALVEGKFFFRFVANVHDEVQMEIRREDVDTIGALAVQCMITAGEVLELRCPVTGEYHFGANWSDTH